MAGGKPCLDGDAPVCAQPDDGLKSDDSAGPYDGPFLGAEVVLVEARGEIVADKDGPDDGKRPNIGVEVCWEWREKLGRLDLRVVNEWCHGVGRLID